MYCDSRGGHNRKQINEIFFKSWSPEMAYILGLIFADGAIEDVRKSSRTCYIAVTSKDKSLIEQVKNTLSSNHNIYRRKQSIHTFSNGESYLCAETFTLRIGNKKMYQDLIDLGVTPRKSLRLRLPKIPDKYFNYFLRGYFDGDGCVSIYLKRNRKTKIIQVIFTCGSYQFLKELSHKVDRLISTGDRAIIRNSRAFKLSYKKMASLNLLSYMYKDLEGAPYLSRKYESYQSFLLKN